MMTTAAKPAGGKSAGGSFEEAEAAAPAPSPAPAGASTWPSALRIDVELAESHARRTGAAGRIGRLNEKKNRPEAIATRPTSQTTNYRNTSLADGRDGGHESTRDVGAGAGLRDDAEVEGHVRGVRPAVPATDGMERLRDRMKSCRRSGIITRSNGRRPVAHGKKTVLFESNPKKPVAADGEGRTCDRRGLTSGSNDIAVGAGTSIDDFSSAVNRIVGKRGKCDVAGAVTGGGTMTCSSESTEDGQDSTKRFRGCGGNERGQEKKVSVYSLANPNKYIADIRKAV